MMAVAVLLGALGLADLISGGLSGTPRGTVQASVGV